MTRSLIFKKYTSLFLRQFLFQNGACFEAQAQSDLAAGVLNMPNFQLASCAIDAGVFDSGIPDAGVSDAGTADSGVPQQDAGFADAGMSESDAGTAGADAGVSDAGDPIDAGSVADSGGTRPPVDAGTDTAPQMPQGCGCQFSTSLSLGLLLCLKRVRRLTS